MLASVWGQHFKLQTLFANADEVTLGRNNNNTIVLNSSIAPSKDIPDSLVLQLSRHHARLSVRDGQLQVMDNATLNGTFVNNQRLPSHTWKVLKHKDVISLGGTNPLEVQGTITDNPWTFKVKVPEEFLAHYTPLHLRLNAETQPAEHVVAAPQPQAQEVFTFSASRPRQPPRAQELSAVEVIDLTLDDDIEITEQPPKAKRVRRPSSANAIEVLTESEIITAAASAPLPSAAAAAAAAPPPAPDIAGGVNEEFTCPICQELVVAAYTLVPCGHMYCGECLASWLENKQDCPTCREKCTAPPVRQNAVDNVVAKTAASLNATDKAVWEEKKTTWEANRSALETKLKSLGGRLGGRNAQQASALRGAQMLHSGLHSGLFSLGIPGLDFVMQGMAGGGMPGTVALPQQYRSSALPARNARRRQEQERLEGRHPVQANHAARAPVPRPAVSEYHAQYATGRERCTACHRSAARSSLVLGIRPTPTGRQERSQASWNWYHFQCFPRSAFENARLIGIGNLRNLLPADASRVRERFSS